MVLSISFHHQSKYFKINDLIVAQAHPVFTVAA